jgi:ABC-type polysaccharide/polyol phosphate export permease
MVLFVEQKEKIHDRIRRYFDLIMGLALRDIKMRYQLSILGLYWAVLNPLLTAIIWSFVFSRIFRAQGIEGAPYVVFVFCGFTFWSLFANSLMSAVTCLTGNASVLSKLYFPRLILPTASVLARLVDLVFSLLVLGMLMAFYRVAPSQVWCSLPLLLLIELIFTLGMAYIVSALNVLYRDMGQVLGVLLMFWMYISPILYTMEQVPSGIRDYFILNPIGQLIQMQTNTILGNGRLDFSALGVTTLLSVGVFLLGLLLFHKLEPVFAEVM